MEPSATAFTFYHAWRRNFVVSYTFYKCLSLDFSTGTDDGGNGDPP